MEKIENKYNMLSFILLKFSLILYILKCSKKLVQILRSIGIVNVTHNTTPKTSVNVQTLLKHFKMYI